MKLTSQLQEIMFTQPPNKQFATFLKKNVEFSLSTLDPKRDKLVIKKLLEFRENYAQFMADCCSEQEDAIILHGDCWISNILFRRNKVSFRYLHCVFATKQSGDGPKHFLTIDHFPTLKALNKASPSMM